MLETAVIVALFVFIIGVGILSLDQLKKWGIGLANDLIALREKWELSQIKVEEKRLELERRYESFQEKSAG